MPSVAMEPSESKPVIGVVGGIGAGKSTVAAELVRLGCGLIDADAIGHELLSDPDVQAELRRRWGEGGFGPDGGVDRGALARRVFHDPQELAALNAIMHPRMRRRMEERIARLAQDPSAAAVVIDAAVLFEAGWDDLCTHVVFVQAPEDARARRVQASRGWDRATWTAREKSQISLDSKARRCYVVLENSSSVSRLQEQVRKLFCRVIHVAERP
jgi:dephospho-CoA kinase